jgi:inorganic triphosphatase YgiF
VKFEIEIKLRLPDKLEKVRRALRDRGFRVSKTRVHESNVLFDTPKRLLRSHGKLVRVRRVGVHTVLTFKGPSQPGRYKKRQEIEMSFPDGNALEQIPRQLFRDRGQSALDRPHRALARLFDRRLHHAQLRVSLPRPLPGTKNPPERHAIHAERSETAAQEQ